jgi:plasmid stabilization system protein ParE
MKYQVDISANAKSDLRRYFNLAFAHAPRTAERWLDRFHAALSTLADLPERCALAPESKLTRFEVRQMHFGKRRGAFRVLFAIQGDQVRVLHIRRASRDTADLEQLFGDEPPPT